MSHGARELSPDRLRRICDPHLLPFESTAHLPPLDGVIGQQRALQAVSFGIGIRSEGYHMYAAGPAGSGKTTTLLKYLRREVGRRAAPDDWLYVNNFHDPDRPRALRLPAGKGRVLRDDLDRFVEELKTQVPQAFEAKEYAQEQAQLEQRVQKRSKALFQELEQKARERGFGLLQTPQGLLMAPMADGELLGVEQLERLGEAQRWAIERNQEELERELREVLRRAQALQQEGREQALELDRRAVGLAVGHLVEGLKAKYAAFPAVLDHLEQARGSLLKGVPAFKQLKQLEQGGGAQELLVLGGERVPSFDEYRANLIVDHGEAEGAPLSVESNPIVPNLVGRIEHQGQFGTLVTNFRLIKAGALHRCNGGYLLIDATELLTKPLSWQFLKRALKNREIAIEGMGEAFGALTTRTLQPEAIPLDIKVILIGDAYLYYLLYQADEDFRELFKVKADFETQMAWEPATLEQYARFVGSVCREEGLRHFRPSGVAKVIEQAARAVSHQEKLATRFGETVDLIRQASYWAGVNGSELVEGRDVQRAVDEQVYRANRIEERLRAMIEEGTLLIDTSGAVVGQVNGLAVLPLGDYAFGKPSRITARAHIGTEGVVNIDREANLGGPIHTKGALILAGYLGGKYAVHTPLALSASIVFEQSYEGVDGDSASSAELYALLSSLSGLPLRQDLAVTGSVNQHGEVQAIGGVNEKVEGFFEVCRVKGLTGTQGVVIPQANLKHLMLREQVVQAVSEGMFHIYPVASIDEGMALLTGCDAGAVLPDGSYPEGTVNGAVQRRIGELADKVKPFARSEPSGP